MAKSWKRLALVVGIIIAGTSITAYTNHYITKQEQMYAVEDIAETIPEQILAGVSSSMESSIDHPAEYKPMLRGAGIPESAPAAPTEALGEPKPKQSLEAPVAAAFSAEPAVSDIAADEAGLSEQEVLPESAAGADSLIAPVQAEPETLPEAAKQSAPLEEPAGISAAPLETALDSAYLQSKNRLEELDKQIQQMRDNQVESTAYSIKALADTELKLWETELSSIYMQIMDRLNSDEETALARDQRQWMNTRDAAAEKAAPQTSGGSIESAEYTASLAASTRQRAYDLLENYRNYLK